MKELLLNELYSITDKQNVLLDEPMSKHTTFRVGGKADLFVTPKSIKEAADIVRLLLTNNEEFYIVGNGSNLLVSDDGYRGCIVCISNGMDAVTIDGNTITAEAGAMLSKVANIACENDLDGLVFASGIPGSVGGAVVMNAGAYGGEMKDIISQVTLFDMESLQIVTLDNSQMQFSYRNSIVKSHPYIVLSATYEMTPGNKDDIRQAMNELSQKRREKQPLEYPSAGSTFKRPEGYFAGKLIEDAGLKGYSVGGAMVSTKHSGFVINAGDATADDIITLIRDVRKCVFDKYGVYLEPEVCMIGSGLEI